ncbi:LysR substrate-binding domain-containing protein [Jonesia quinghaiensis]|uniref:LysR substrate-binding domain-containing protein n=1 Tax=Jonesia quinghaiensis TaxID=262806 RepID=UPI0004164CEE|nr:LysR substrate-binding domain-containing protein [Jonesia quinghaiensis]
MTQQWPDLRVLELLIAISEHGSLSAGARAVGMAQPNASRAVAGLERDLGVTLLARLPRGSQLSDAGFALVGHARLVVSAAQALLDASGHLAVDRPAQLRVAASMTVAEHLLPEWLVALRDVEPRISVRLTAVNSSGVYDAVEAGECDLGFVETPQRRTGLRSVVVAHDRLVVVAHPTHPWADKARRGGSVSAEELAATPLVVRERGSGTRKAFDEALRSFHPVAPALELESIAAIRSTVRAGGDPAVLSELAVAWSLAQGELVRVPVTGVTMRREIRAVWQGHRAPGAAERLVAVAQQAAAQRSPRSR